MFSVSFYIRFSLALLLWAFSIQAFAGEPIVILISLDGTPPSAATDPEFATLARLARNGAVASRMIPVFPSNTFPNHVSLVTGVRPEQHGIVNNHFHDSARGKYRYDSNPNWIEAEPLWSIAQRHGVISAAYHWVGSEGKWINGKGPQYWKAFDSKIQEKKKVTQVLEWLDMEDPSKRPRLITVWFHGMDHAAHQYGPDSKKARKSLRKQDEALGTLVQGIEQRGLSKDTTLILVSDHGMAMIQSVLPLRKALKTAGIKGRVVGSGGFAMLYLDDLSQKDAALKAVAKLGLEAIDRDASPDSLASAHPRFGDVLILAPIGVGMDTKLLKGAHGYRSRENEMAALFLAYGNGVGNNLSLGEVRVIDVAPTVLEMLEIPVPDWMAGQSIKPRLQSPKTEAQPSSPR